jgi:hypothetical protein
VARIDPRPGEEDPLDAFMVTPWRKGRE